MRVLITASTLPRWAGDAVPAFVLDQARALRRHDPGLEIHILAPHHAGAATEEAIDGVTVHRFRYVWPASLQRLVYPAILPNLRRNGWLWLQVPLLFAAEFLAVLGFCLRWRPAVIYSHWFAPQGLVGGAVALLTGIPHVLTSHSSDVHVMRRMPWLGPVLVRFVMRRVRACTVVSRRTGEKLFAFFADPAERAALGARTLTLPMGVDVAALRPVGTDERAAIRRDLGLDGRTVYLFLGRLTEKKGIDVLLRAFAPVAQARRDVVLLIAGEGELRSALEREVRLLGMESRVQFTGFVSGEAKRHVIAAADAMVVPSVVAADDDAEGLPVALLEGLAAGLVCVATDVSGADDVIADGTDGLVVPQRDEAALASALIRAHDMTPAQRQAFAEHARRRAQEFDWPAVAAAHYRHLLLPR
jgi:glycosyltransferase involved in cell wall biosynthesis